MPAPGGLGAAGNAALGRYLADTSTPGGARIVRRDPLDFATTRRNYNSAAEYYALVVEPWLATVEDEHPEAGGAVDDVRLDVDTGFFDVSDWGDVETMVLMVNARIGAENPHFRGETEKVVDYSRGWVVQQGRFSILSGGSVGDARSDLVTLIQQCSGNLYSTQIQTLVGGIAVKGKGVKKVSGLHDPTARIDVQNPIGNGTYNVQYQVGGASVAGVIFVAEDPSDVVLAKLLASYNTGNFQKSPRAPV